MFGFGTMVPEGVPEPLDSLPLPPPPPQLGSAVRTSAPTHQTAAVRRAERRLGPGSAWRLCVVKSVMARGGRNRVSERARLLEAHAGERAQLTAGHDRGNQFSGPPRRLDSAHFGASRAPSGRHRDPGSSPRATAQRRPNEELSRWECSKTMPSSRRKPGQSTGRDPDPRQGVFRAPRARSHGTDFQGAAVRKARCKGANRCDSAHLPPRGKAPGGRFRASKPPASGLASGRTRPGPRA